jgi:tricarboxylate carrier
MNQQNMLQLGETLPLFCLGASRYDQSTYFGRLKHFASIIDPRLLFIPSREILQARSILERFQQSPDQIITPAENERLWRAQRLVDSAVNPATGEVIHPIARMCAFIPASLPITLGMLTMTSTASILALQWINQSYNAVFNYSHRSRAENETSEVLKGYALATFTSCGLALGLSKFANRIKPPWLISTFAVMAAGSANVAFTRSNEITQGIDVRNDRGDILGKSSIAGRYAVGYTILSRSVFLPIPIMVLPGLMSSYAVRKWFTAGIGKRSKLLLDIGCIIAAQTIALPVCIAAFPQTLAFKRNQLETAFHSHPDNSEVVFVRKGV